MAENTTVRGSEGPAARRRGAADLALATVNEIVVTLRERAEDARDGEACRGRRAKLTARVAARDQQVQELPAQGTRRAARAASPTRSCARSPRYAEGRHEHLQQARRARGEPPWSGCATSRSRRGRRPGRGYVDQTVELTQDALGTVASQTQAVGERAAKLVGVELSNRIEGRRRRPPARSRSDRARQRGPGQEAPAKAACRRQRRPRPRAPAKKVTQK